MLMTCKQMNIVDRATMLYLMQNDMICQFEYNNIINNMWMTLEDKFGGISITKIKRLTIKLDAYHKIKQTFYELGFKGNIQVITYQMNNRGSNKIIDTTMNI